MKWLLGFVGLWMVATPLAHGALLGSPLYWTLVAGFVLVWSRARNWRRVSGIATGVLAVLLASMTPAGANAILRLVERPQTEASCQRELGRLHVLLAGGVTRPPLDAGDYGALAEASLMRGVRFAGRYAAGDARVVLVSGGGGAVAESQPLAALLETRGVAKQRIRVETDSRNTWESAQAVKRFVGAQEARIVLSTSALHMRRAALAFTAQGFAVCESVLYSDYLPPGTPGYYFPQVSSLRKAESVVHELMGWVYYRALAWRAG